jgi:hypothetical protein
MRFMITTMMLWSLVLVVQVSVQPLVALVTV